VISRIANHTPKERVVRDIGRVVVAMASSTDQLFRDTWEAIAFIFLIRLWVVPYKVG
jgi:hypothetical protein